ncbi:MAG: 30S ribosomal protein S1 [Acidobacteriia bacterium]|nr:30S ribosomal protein S1 [Terriglobia bacterium]
MVSTEDQKQKGGARAAQNASVKTSMEFEDNGSMANYAQLIDSYSSFRTAEEGDLLKGTVLKVTRTDVIVDVGFKSEGVIKLAEFLDSKGDVTVKPGDQIDVILEHAEGLEGTVRLSHERAKRMRVWDDIEKAYNEQTILKGVVLERVKGGLSVDIGVKAFLPGSQIDVKPVKNLDSLRGQSIQCKVIKMNKKRGNIVLSRKIVLEEENRRRREHTLENLQEGSTVNGTIKNITEYGVFVDLGGIDGLLHISDISWGRPPSTHEAFHVGQEITLKVLKFDREKGRVSLGLKQMFPDPWVEFSKQYPAGSRVKGKVVNLTDYGAFVEVAEGVEGLIHVSEMSWSKRVKHPSKILNVGDEVEVAVLDIHIGDRKLSLGLKQTEPDPWQTLTERYPLGSIIEGRVRNLTDFGAFVEIEEGIDGLVHVSDLSWTKRVKHPSEILKKGDVVRAVILNIDVDNRRLSLGVKQAQTEPFQEFAEKHHVGEVIHGPVVRTSAFGAFVDLGNGLEGLCHFSEFEDKEKSDAKSGTNAEVGKEYDFKIIKMSPEDRRISLSQRGAMEDSQRKALAAYQSETAGASRTRIEELVTQFNAPRKSDKDSTES